MTDFALEIPKKPDFCAPAARRIPRFLIYFKKRFLRVYRALVQMHKTQNFRVCILIKLIRSKHIQTIQFKNRINSIFKQY